MQNIQNSITDDQIKKRFTELRYELGSDKLKYDADNLCEIYQELYKKGYIISGFIGNGGEGVVFEAVKKDDKSIVAVKCVFVVDKQIIQKEVDILKKLQEQPFIHQFLDGFYSTNNKFFFYITEKLHCDLKSIMDNLASRKQQLPYNSIIAFMIQITTALNTLKSNNIFHFDVKPVNVFYDKVNKCFKLADYGMAKKVDTTGNMNEFQSVFTTQLSGFDPKYISPEVRNQVGTYNNRTDVYSLGLILLELSRGVLLEFNETKEIRENYENLLKYLSKNNQHYQLNELIKQMLIIDRSKRITPEDLLQKLESLQDEQESNLYTYLQTQVDDLTFQGIKQLYSSSLTQINIDQIKDITRQIKFDQPHKKVNQIMNQQQFQAQQQPQLSYQLNNYFSDASGYQQQNYQQPSYTQPIQQQLVAQSKYPYQYSQQQQQQQSPNQQQIIQPVLKKKQHKQLKFKEWIKTVKQLTEAEEALAKYQNDQINVAVDVGLTFHGYQNELTKLGASVVASRLALSLEKCSLSITSLSLSFGHLKIGPEGMKSISQSIGMMHQNLTTLNLSFWSVEIGPEEASSLATAIEKCSKNLLVVGLKFDGGYMDSDQIKYFSQSLEKCDKMTTLGLLLYNCSSDKVNIDPTGASYLASSLPKCTSLIEFALWLKTCDISNEGLQSLGSSLSKCEKLTRLNARICRDSKESPMNEQSIEEFGSSLARCPNLITLSVEFQQNYQSLAYAIAPSLPLFAKLTTLTLFLRGEDAKHTLIIQTNLKECQHLTSLCLHLQNGYNSNQWTLDNTSSLVESLEESNLTTLKLISSFYAFGEQSKQQQEANRLGKSLSKFKKLASLYLFFWSSENNPTQFISTLLFNHLAENKNITTLGLDAHLGGITSSDSQMIGESLEKCKYLKALNLYLWDNIIKSEGALTISQSLSKCVHLTALDLSIIEDYCCNKDYPHKHVYTKYMDSVSPTITNDLKKCKNFGELKVDIKSNYGEYGEQEIKLGIMTFESKFWWIY